MAFLLEFCYPIKTTPLLRTKQTFSEIKNNKLLISCFVDTSERWSSLTAESTQDCFDWFLYHNISITLSISHLLYHICITLSLSHYLYHIIFITLSLSYHLYHIFITSSLSHHLYHIISITLSLSHYLYHIISITSVSHHLYHIISITLSLSHHLYHIINITLSISHYLYHICITSSLSHYLYHIALLLVWSVNKYSTCMFVYQGLKTKGYEVLFNQEAYRTLLHSPPWQGTTRPARHRVW